MSGTYYDILGVTSGATQRDIKVAYRKLVQAHHPDVNPSGSDDMIKKINVAYDTLSNPSERLKYDRSLQRPFQTSAPSYNAPTTARPRRRPPPSSYYQDNNVTYVYSTKTKLQGLAAVVFAILFTYFGFTGMHYYASYYYFEEGQEAEANEDYNLAFSNYQWAIRNWGSKNLEATFRMIEINRKFDNYESMMNDINTAFTYNPDSTQAGRLYFLQGIGFEHKTNFPEAAISFNKSLNLKYNKDSIYAQLGPIYLGQLQQYNEASKIYSYLLQDDINNLEDYFNRATCYQLQGEHQLAIDDLLIVLKEDPYNGKILFQLGRSYLALGQKEIACKYFRFAKKQGVNIDPNELSQTCD